MRVAAFLPLFVWCLAVGASQAPAADGTSPLSWLGNSKSKPRPIHKVSASSEATTPMFTRMTDGTKKFVNNTKSLFVPKKPPVKRRGVTATHRAVRPEPPKQSFFKRMFNPEPPPPPRTVNEWMSLEQIHP